MADTRTRKVRRLAGLWVALAMAVGVGGCGALSDSSAGSDSQLKIVEGTADVVVFLRPSVSSNYIDSVIEQVLSSQEVACVQRIDPGTAAEEFNELFKDYGGQIHLEPDESHWVLKVALRGAIGPVGSPVRVGRARRLASSLDRLPEVEDTLLPQNMLLPRDLASPSCEPVA
jgi:hypothetical protein